MENRPRLGAPVGHVGAGQGVVLTNEAVICKRGGRAAYGHVVRATHANEIVRGTAANSKNVNLIIAVEIQGTGRVIRGNVNRAWVADQQSPARCE